MAEELKVENPKAKKQPVSVKSIIVKVIIAILSLLMIGSAYYIIILLTADKNEEEASYGTYDGEQILLEYNNVFYNALLSDSSFQDAYASGDYTALWNSYYKGYQSQVVYIALSKLAAEAGISAPQELVNRAIIESGVYNDEDGNFSVEKYNSTEAQVRSNSESYMRSIYPYQVAMRDIYSTVTAAKEREFVKELASDVRNLEYFIIDYNAYSDDDAIAYAMQNSDLFKRADITIASYATETEANNAFSAISAGTKAEETDGVTISDLTASIATIQESLDEASDIDYIVNLSEGLVSAPVKTSGAYSLFIMNSDFVNADLSDEAILSEVKNYIYKNDAETVKPAIESAKEEADKMAASDFEKAAELYGNGIITVASVSDNVGDSQLISGISTVDSNGTLASAASDETVSKEIFTAKKGAVCGPIAVEGGYVVVRIADTEVNSPMGSLIDTLYDYYAYQYPLNDITNAIFASDKLVDNFTTQFLTMMFGSMNNN